MSGDITAGELADGCDLKTVSGDQRVRKLVAGEAEFRTVSGELTIGVARGTAVMVDAQSLSGSLSSEIDLYQDEPEGRSQTSKKGGERTCGRTRSVATCTSTGPPPDGCRERAVPVRAWFVEAALLQRHATSARLSGTRLLPQRPGRSGQPGEGSWRQH